MSESEVLKKHLIIYNNISDNLDSFQNKIKDKIACKPNCSFCCNQKVTVSISELELLVDFIRRNLDEISLLNLKKNSCANGMIYQQNLMVNKPCSLLNSEGKCSVYSIRPFECRRYISFSVDTCKEFQTDSHAFDKNPTSYDELHDKKSVEYIIKEGSLQHGIFELNYSIFLALTYNDWRTKLINENPLNLKGNYENRMENYR